MQNTILSQTELRQALQIFMKYNLKDVLQHNKHTIMVIYGVSKEEVSSEDIQKLKELGFNWLTEYGGWGSFNYEKVDFHK